MTPAEALQKALRGEHAALYLYGVLGAQASQSRQPELFARLEEGYDAHRAARDELTELVSAKGLDPAPAEVSAPPSDAVLVPLQLHSEHGVLSLISTITVFGTPNDVTLAELALETFFPADAFTADYLRNLAKSP